MRLSLGRAMAALLLTLAFAGMGIPDAQAAPVGICRLRFVIKTGDENGAGIRDDSFEHIRLGGQEFEFEDWNGDEHTDERPRPYHHGGTGDESGIYLRWNAHLAVCATTADLAGGFTFEHVSFADDIGADNWDLAEVKILNCADIAFKDCDMSGTVLVDRKAPPGQFLHRFLKNADQVFTVPVDVGPPPDPPPADPSRRICRVRFEITTGDRDFWGIRDDSFEHIRLGGQEFLFDDWDGDEQPNERPRPYHRGGTGDRSKATFNWDAHLAVCATTADLAGGFTFEHVSFADDIGADNWDLAGLRVLDCGSIAFEDCDGSGTVLISRPSAPGQILHEFHKNADQVFTTLDLDTDNDGLSDRVELQGITHGGTVDTWLRDHHADPCRLTIAVELDWLNDGQGGGDKPDGAAIDEAVAMFGAAPLRALPACPYGGEPERGVQLLVDAEEEIPVTREERLAPLDVEQDDGQTPFQRFRAAHFTPGRAGLFRYNLWGFRHNTTNESGWCCDGKDFVVTLGTMRDRPVRVQSGTFVHELGHALGLKHGGTDEVNYKPNYLSAMNYRYQATGIPDFAAWQRLDPPPPATDGGTKLLQALDQVSTLDYSRDRLPTLRRQTLSELTGIGTDTHAMAAWWDNDGVLRVGDGSLPLDWNAKNGLETVAVKADINGEFQKCVVGTDPRPGSSDNRLETDVGPRSEEFDDLRAYERIYAGLNGRCQTVPAPSDRTALLPGRRGRAEVGFDYPAAFGYDGGLLGVNDWNHIQPGFSMGDSEGAVVADEATELTTDEITAHRARIVDALVGASGPAPVQAPRWGYAYMDRATTAEAPIGAVTPVNPYWQWSTGRLDPATADRRATVVHTATGQYEVRLPGIASAAGVAHVTAYRTVYRGRTCGVVGYAPDGPDELVRVRCFNETGAPVDWWFTIFFAAPGKGDHPYATVRYDDAAGGTATVDPVSNAGTFNSGGGVDRVLREGTGRYRVILEGRTFAAGTGYVQVTPYGGGAPARCNPVGTTPGADRLEITVACRTIAGGAPADSPWLLSYVEGAGLHRDAGTPAAYVSVTGDPADPVVDAARSFSSNGEVPSVTRLGVGYYRLTWNTLGKTGDDVQVTATGPGGGYCHLGVIDSYAAPPRLSVYVWCHTPTGVRGDSTFGVAYIRAP
ncbi:hypothetical protein ACWEN6_27655 [Sphaerisporangium sp. NPDC004334]